MLEFCVTRYDHSFIAHTPQTYTASGKRANRVLAGGPRERLDKVRRRRETLPRPTFDTYLRRLVLLRDRLHLSSALLLLRRRGRVHRLSHLLQPLYGLVSRLALLNLRT